MWNLALLLLFILHADGKSSNLCRMNPPHCDGDKIIEIDVIRCVKPADLDMWSVNEMMIKQTCNHVNYCKISNLTVAVDSCCGDKDYKQDKRPKLRFSYSCVQREVVTTKATPKMMPTTLSSPVVHGEATKQTGLAEKDNYCVSNICHQKPPYCSAGTEIAIMKISDSLQVDEVMNSLTYYCNKRQRCSDDYGPYVDNKCRSDDQMKLHYVCMKEKVMTTVMCDYEEIIDNLEGQIRSSDYPNMIPAGTSNCRIKIHFHEISTLELYLLDLPAVEVVYENEYREWSSTLNVTSKHMIFQPAHQVLLSVDFDKLPQRRIWMYYRVFPASTYRSNVQFEFPWTYTCHSHMTTPEPMHVTSKMNPSSSEAPKGSTVRSSSSANKEMPMMHKTDANQGIEELSTAPHIVIPDGIPVDTEVVDKSESATFPVGPSTSSSSSSSSSEDGMNPVGKPSNPTNHYGEREKASSASETPTTGLYSREVVIGLIAGVVILACLVIILLTALFASMRRRRRSLADGEERDERHNSGPGGTTNENLVSFQYLKTFPTEGDNGTLGTTKSQQSEDSLGGESASKKNLISKPIKKKNSLAPSENESNKTADTVSSKDDSVFHCLKNIDDFSSIQIETGKSADSNLMTKNDNSFTGRSRLDADASKCTDNPEGKGDDDVFRDVPHFYVNGDDYALVQKDSRSPRSTLISDKSSIYANSSPRPKSGSSGSVQDSDVLEWTKGFNLAV